MSHSESSPNPYSPSQRSWPRRMLGKLAGIVLIPVLKYILEQPKMRNWTIHHLSNRLSIDEASFDKSVPRELHHLEGFHDLYWLFSSNKLNHGLIRLRIDQAAYLYRLVKQMEQPRVAELGRFKGGATFLLAAAGAHVLSLDNDALPGQPQYLEELQSALEHFGLQDNVEAILGDALHHPCEPESLDLVMIDFAHTRELAEAGFEHWWPAVKPGRCLIMSDGRQSPWLEVVEYVAQLDIAARGGVRMPEAPGSFVCFQKREKAV